jgi:hypothetical protein
VGKISPQEIFVFHPQAKGMGKAGEGGCEAPFDLEKLLALHF